MGDLLQEDEEALLCVTQGSEIEEQNYSQVHRIILGLSLLDLEKQILAHLDAVNTTDIMGRTPLAWAACRGDDRAIVTLLRYGAKVNTLDIQNSAAVCHAPDRNHGSSLPTRCKMIIVSVLIVKISGPGRCCWFWTCRLILAPTVSNLECMQSREISQTLQRLDSKFSCPIILQCLLTRG